MRNYWTLARLAKPAGILAAAVLLAAGVWPATPAAATITQAPKLAAPANGSTLPTFAPALQWTNPPGTTQYQLQVVPFNNDGPGVNLIIGGAGSTFNIPAPPAWYGLLPDMSYTWRVRASDATVSIAENDSRWGPWSDSWTFRTPAASSASISLLSPTGGALVAGPTPVLTWSASSPSVFYYEVQVSKDPGFGPNAFLYWALLHGGVTLPMNSYAVPASAPLEAGTSYYWRVRPRVQGDGAPVAWSPPASFRTPVAQSLFLQVEAPQDEAVVYSPSVVVRGRTQQGAIVTVNSILAAVDQTGGFSATVPLEEGPNDVSIIASDAAGNQVTETLTVTYIP